MRKGFLIIIAFACLLLSLAIWVLGLYQERHYSLAFDEQFPLSLPDLPTPPPVPLPVLVASPAAVPYISARGAYILDLKSSTILYEKASSAPLHPASTVKIMTALVARASLNLDDLVTITPADMTVSNTLGLKVGETLTVADLLQALLIASSNEAAQVLANHYPSGKAAFVLRMNSLSQELGLDHTHFVSPEGFDAAEQTVSAADLAVLSRELLKDDYLSSLVRTPKTTISSAQGNLHELVNTNQLLDQTTMLTVGDKTLHPIFYGLKTGTTPLALEALVSAVHLEDHDLLLVVLESQTRYNDTVALLSWVAQNYAWQN
jgi:D-alanyl-D-alanine carboxypeptidase